MHAGTLQIKRVSKAARLNICVVSIATKETPWINRWVVSEVKAFPTKENQSRLWAWIKKKQPNDGGGVSMY